MKSSAKQRRPANPQPFQAFWFLYLNNEPDFKTSLVCKPQSFTKILSIAAATLNGFGSVVLNVFLSVQNWKLIQYQKGEKSKHQILRTIFNPKNN